MPLNQQDLSKIVWDDAPQAGNNKGIDTSKVVWDDTPEPLIAGRYTPEILATKMIPQFTKGLEEGFSSIPGLRNLSALALKGPNAAIKQEVSANIPDPRGFGPTVARTIGQIAPDMAASSPFLKGSELLKGLSPLMRMALGYGAYTGTKEALNNGTSKDIAIEAGKGALGTIIGGKIFEGVGAGINAGTKALNKAPAAIINSLIKPLLKDFSYGKNPGRGVAREGIIGNTFEELVQNITGKLGELGNKLNTIYSKAKNKLNLTKALDPLDEAITYAEKNPRVNKAIITRLQDTLKDILGVVDDPKTGLSYVTRKLKNITAKEAFELKQTIGDLTRWTGQMSDDKIVNKALKQVYGRVKEALNKALPKTKDLNERYADLLSAKTAAIYRDKIASRQNLVSLSGRLLGGGSIIAGLATGNKELILAGISEIGIENIMRSPGAKTKIAAGLAKLPVMDVQKIINKYPILKQIPRVASRLSGPLATNKK